MLVEAGGCPHTPICRVCGVPCYMSSLCGVLMLQYVESVGVLMLQYVKSVGCPHAPICQVCRVSSCSNM